MHHQYLFCVVSQVCMSKYVSVSGDVHVLLTEKSMYPAVIVSVVLISACS